PVWHVFWRRCDVPPRCGLSQSRAPRIPGHACNWRVPATQCVSFCLLYAGWLPWPARSSRARLACSHDGSVVVEGLSAGGGAPPALLLTVLARARHHLGPDLHDCLPDGSPSMTDTHWDVAPGDRPAIPASERSASSGLLVYTIGLLLAAI